MGFRFKNSPPANPDDFELLCLRLLKAHWNCPTLERYVRKGYEQHGIDIIDMSGSEPLRAAQCKLYDSRETLPPADIEAEVNAARDFQFKLGTYAICTTARISPQAHQTILSINQKHRQSGLFTVELFTWDRLDELLEEFTTIRDDVYKTLSGAVAAQIQNELAEMNVRLTSIGTQPVPAVQEIADAMHAEIDEARDLIRGGQPQTGRLLLQRLRTRKWEQMSPRHRYRVLANIGAAYLSERDLGAASQFFLDAATLQPDDPQAAENEALAYLISMPIEKAFEAITRVREKFPHSPRVNAYWVSASPPTDSWQQIEQRLSASDLSTPEVTAELARRALADGEFGVSEQLATRVIEQRPKWSFPRFLKVRASVLRVIQLDSLAPSMKLREVRAALGPLGEAVEAAIIEHDSAIQTLCLLERFQIHLILGEMSEAETDVFKAEALSPDDVSVRRAIAELHLRKNDSERAILELHRINAPDRSDVALLLAEALRKRGTPADVGEAIDLLKKLVDSPERVIRGGREYVATVLLQLLSQAQRLDEFGPVLDSLLNHGVSRPLVAAFRARTFYLQNSIDDANRLAEEAVSLVQLDTSSTDIHWIAGILSELGRHAEALPLWQRIASEIELTDYTRALLDCAQRLGKDDLILDICSALRRNGVVDHDLILCEVLVLERYDLDEAIAALKSYLGKCPDDKIARLRLSTIGVNWNRPEIIDGRPAVMPLVSEVNVLNGRAAVQVMKFGGYPDEALAYAYDLLRLHFADAEAHRAFTLNLLPFEPKPNVPEFTEVKPGSAVCYVEEGEDREDWMVVEDAADPEISRCEYGPDHPLSKTMEGKRVGERVVLSVGSIGERAATIKSIVSKYVFRYWDSMHNWQIRFPNVPGLESFKVVRTNQEGKEEFDPSPMILSIERLADNVQRLKELYAKSPIPIFLFGSARGKGAIQTTLYLAQQDDMAVYSCIGSADERRDALTALDTAGTWIIEPSALATIFLLDLEDDLSSFPANLVFSQGAIADFDDMLREDTLYQGEGGVLVKHEGRVALIPQTASERAERVRSFKERMAKVMSASSVRGCLEFAKIEKDRRAVIVKVLGAGGAESIVLAAKPGHLLWTDDSRLAALARNEHGVKSAWTQIVLQWAAQRGYISERKFFASTAKLIGYGYSFTSPSLPALVAAAEMSEWDKARWPLSRAIEQLGSDSIQVRDAVSLIIPFLARVYRENILDERRRALTWDLMDQVAKRPCGIQMVHAIKRVIPSAFGVNALGAAAAGSSIGEWLKKRPIQIT